MGAYRHGTTAREEEILRLWESGRSAAQITAELGLKSSTVSGIIQRLGAPGTSRVAEYEAARAGSAALLAAMHRADLVCIPGGLR